MGWTRVHNSTSSGEEPPRKRRSGALAAAAAEAPTDARFGSLASQVRAHFEACGDWAASQPIVKGGDHFKSGQFNFVGLRELQRLLLTIDSQCSHPCTYCTVKLEDSEGLEALDAAERDALDWLKKHREATTFRLRNGEPAHLQWTALQGFLLPPF